jgi:hypothetical protein
VPFWKAKPFAASLGETQMWTVKNCTKWDTLNVPIDGTIRFVVLSDCHRRIEHFLDVLLAIDQEAHGGPLGTGPRADMAAALTYFATAAPQHAADEEESLFPRLRATTDPTAVQVLELVDRLEQGFQQPPDCCRLPSFARWALKWPPGDQGLPDTNQPALPALRDM